MGEERFPLDTVRKSIQAQIEATWRGPQNDSLRLASVMHGDITRVYDLVNSWTASHIHDYFRDRDFIPVSSEYKRRMIVALTFRFVREELVKASREIVCDVDRDWEPMLDETRIVLKAIANPERRIMIYLINRLYMLPQDVALMFDCEPARVHTETHKAREQAKRTLGVETLRTLAARTAERKPPPEIRPSDNPDPWAREPLTLPPSPVWESFEAMVGSSSADPSAVGGDHD